MRTRARCSRLLSGLLALAAAGCVTAPAGPPEIVLDRTACRRCSMLVSEPAFAAAALPAGEREARVYDDAGCLFAALAEEPGGGAAARLWFQDADGSGWVEAAEAVLVAVPGGVTPMGSGVVAFRDGAAARRFAAARGGEVVELAAARERFAGGRPG
ncbi:MAG TPA: nitrous oxide reductase accessory protein NosL [Thermoanaerobaculia bacterium]